MSVYILLKNIHILIALASGIGFGLRGYVRLVMRQPLGHPMMRIGPQVVDTLLLISGLALWVLTGLALDWWFGLKLLLVLTYAALGVSAFRADSPSQGITFYLAALLSFLGAAVLSASKPGL